MAMANDPAMQQHIAMFGNQVLPQADDDAGAAAGGGGGAAFSSGMGMDHGIGDDAATDGAPAHGPLMQAAENEEDSSWPAGMLFGSGPLPSWTHLMHPPGLPVAVGRSDRIASTKLRAADLPSRLRVLHLSNVGIADSREPLPTPQLRELLIRRSDDARAFQIGRAHV